MQQTRRRRNSRLLDYSDIRLLVCNNLSTVIDAKDAFTYTDYGPSEWSPGMFSISIWAGKNTVIEPVFPE